MQWNICLDTKIYILEQRTMNIVLVAIFIRTWKQKSTVATFSHLAMYFTNNMKSFCSKIKQVIKHKRRYSLWLLQLCNIFNLKVGFM